MKILKFEDTIKYIRFIPRISPVDITDVIVTSEITNIESNLSHTLVAANNYYELTFLDDIFDTPYEKYSILITSLDKIIYKGKLQVLKNDDSIQDFIYAEITPSKIIKY